MGTSFWVIFAWLFFLVMVTFWIYFFIYSSRHDIGRPWGFGLVIVGLLVSGYGYAFYITGVSAFQINFLFLTSLFGILLNISNIREQFHVQGIGELLRFLGLGLILGLLIGLFLNALLGSETFHIDPLYTPIAIIASIVQVSIGEELLHRGFFLSFLQKYGFNSRYAIVVQSLIFAAAHIPRYSGTGNWAALGGVFLMGIAANYLTWKNNNLIPAIVLHLTSNLMGIVWWLITT